MEAIVSYRHKMKAETECCSAGLGGEILLYSLVTQDTSQITTCSESHLVHYSRVYWSARQIRCVTSYVCGFSLALRLSPAVALR